MRIRHLDKDSRTKYKMKVKGMKYEKRKKRGP